MPLWRVEVEMNRALTLIALLSSLTAAGPATKPSGHNHGGAAGDGVTSFDVYVEGPRVHLLSVRADSAGGVRAHELRYTRSDDGGASWSQSTVVGSGQPAPTSAHRGADVQLAAVGERLVAAWTARASPQDRRERLVTAFSNDRGRTWRAGANPSLRDGVVDELPDLTVDERGTFHLVWIELRDRKASLRYARSTDGGATWSPDVALDAACCECCWNAVTCGSDGTVYVLYRDIGPRDMAIVRSRDGGETWSAPVTVGLFGWDTSACPHVGGGLVVGSGEPIPSLHAVVWTGHETSSGAYALASTDGGATWGEPQALGGPSSGAWHVDIARNGDLLAVVWDAYTESGTAVFGAKSHDAGQTWSAPVRLSAPGTVATHPRVFPSGASFRAAWTEQAPKSLTRVVVREMD